MSVTVFMFSVMVLGSFVVLTFMLVIGIPLSVSNDPYIGLFGWMTLKENRFYVLLVIAILVNMMGTMGFVRAMQYFENVVIAVATLLEPLMATLIAYALGVGGLPGMLGWAGNVLVVLGTLGVVYPSVNSHGASAH